MVSDGYQGGCECENAPGLRSGTDNVEIAALAAPRPLKIIGATGDWTARAITNAYPTLQLVYGRYGASDRVSAPDVFDFPHNYNQTSRERRSTPSSAATSWAVDEGGLDPAEPDELKVRGPPPTSSPSTSDAILTRPTAKSPADQLEDGARRPSRAASSTASPRATTSQPGSPPAGTWPSPTGSASRSNRRRPAPRSPSSSERSTARA